MGFSSNLDLEELLNYLVSGSFLLATMAMGGAPSLQFVTARVAADIPPNQAAVVLAVLFATTALLLGHLFSMVARYGIRIAFNGILGDPENSILPETDKKSPRRACGAFFTQKYRDAFEAKYHKVFGETTSDHIQSNTVPRLVRSYVLHHSESAREIRERIVRSRSFCANLAVALAMSSALNTTSFPLTFHLALWGGAALLTIKQRSLDERESKEIYTHFLVI